jgi:hypothetical protein
MAFKPSYASRFELTLAYLDVCVHKKFSLHRKQPNKSEIEASYIHYYTALSTVRDLLRTYKNIMEKESPPQEWLNTDDEPTMDQRRTLFQRLTHIETQLSKKVPEDYTPPRTNVINSFKQFIEAIVKLDAVIHENREILFVQDDIDRELFGSLQHLSHLVTSTSTSFMRALKNDTPDAIQWVLNNAQWTRILDVNIFSGLEWKNSNLRVQQRTACMHIVDVLSYVLSLHLKQQTKPYSLIRSLTWGIEFVALSSNSAIVASYIGVMQNECPISNFLWNTNLLDYSSHAPNPTRQPQLPDDAHAKGTWEPQRCQEYITLALELAQAII